MKKVKKLLILSLFVGMTATLASCGNKKGGKYDNEVDSLNLSIQEVDGVFNPFFSTSGTDSSVVGMTQISMLGNDKNGSVTYGNDEPVVVLDYEDRTTGEKDVDQVTTYNFVLKNNVKFSNGSPLTIKDVLFNLYVYLDPVYTGSSTIYSTDIVGLKEYRTQSASEKEQEAFESRFNSDAQQRIDSLVEASEEVLDESQGANMSVDDFAKKLQAKATGARANIVNDFTRASELFEEELNNDYSGSIDAYEDVVFTSKSGHVNEHVFETDVEMFLYNEGFITYNKEDDVIECSYSNDYRDARNWTKEQAISYAYQTYMPYKIDEVVQYWATASNLFDELVMSAKEEYLNKEGSERKYKNISGIKFINKDSSVTVNGKEYGVPTYNADGSVASGNEVLQITINNVDPKAIWNFAFAVAPMYYYSNQEQINAFDFESHFGVEYSSRDFMNDSVKNPNKIGVPVGAGPYVASKVSGGTTGVASGDFHQNGVIYYERNDNYIMGKPKIKKVRYQVVSSSRMVDSLTNGEVDFVEPNAKSETIEQLQGLRNKGIAYQSITTAGYGYIGINAGKVPDMEVRQAIMHAIDTSKTVSYYKTTAKPIYRSMSLASWAYPKGCEAYYPYIGGEVPANLDKVSPYYKEYVEANNIAAGTVLSKEDQIKFITDLVESAGYDLNANGVYQNGNNVLKYTFTIAGEVTDHPAWNALFLAGELLNDCGFEITVTTDSNALKKLSTGGLTVWAAAWGSTIDPDMYQVYHRDSTATSILNWGYRQIKLNVGNKYDEELNIVNDLSDLIEQGRETNNQDERARIYSDALDKVMELAVELPTYQRDDLFAYNINKIDQDSLTPKSELSPYNGLTSRFWNVSLKTK